MSNLWFNYFWSSLKGNGPEALVQTVVYGAIAVAIWPPARKAIDRFAKRHADDLKAHVAAENAAIHEKLDHVIKHHPDIPAFHPVKEHK